MYSGSLLNNYSNEAVAFTRTTSSASSRVLVLLESFVGARAPTLALRSVALVVCRKPNSKLDPPIQSLRTRI